MNDKETIDLTSSFVLINHHQLANLVIELDDSVISLSSPVVQKKKSTNGAENEKNNSLYSDEISSSPQPTGDTLEEKGIGDCPVCWDKLGSNPLASTFCGHIFCLQCIEKVVQQSKTCPTCRCVLKGNPAYHPIFI